MSDVESFNTTILSLEDQCKNCKVCMYVHAYVSHVHIIDIIVSIGSVVMS